MRFIGLILSLIICISCSRPSVPKLNNSEEDLNNIEIKRPIIIHNPASKYPQDALDQEIEGEVIVIVTVDKQGNVIDAIIKESDNEIFNDSALAAAKKCKFEPEIREGKPVMVKMAIPYTFEVE